MGFRLEEKIARSSKQQTNQCCTASG